MNLAAALWGFAAAWEKTIDRLRARLDFKLEVLKNKVAWKLRDASDFLEEREKEKNGQ